MTTILLRTLFMYFFILIIYRIMGKREIGKLSVIDLVISIMIAELAVVAIENPNEPLINTISPMLLLPVIQIVMAFVSLKSQKLRELMDGKPSVLIDRGQINEKEMTRQRYNFNDLLSQLREKNISKLQDVEFAILEPSGFLSVIKKNKQPPQPCHASPSYTGWRNTGRTFAKNRQNPALVAPTIKKTRLPEY